jgi:hypothetical protein
MRAGCDPVWRAERLSKNGRACSSAIWRRLAIPVGRASIARPRARFGPSPCSTPECWAAGDHSAREPASTPSNPSSLTSRSTSFLAAGSSPPTKRLTRPGVRSGFSHESKLSATTLLNALITGGRGPASPSRCRSSPRRLRRCASRERGNSRRCPRRPPVLGQDAARQFAHGLQRDGDDHRQARRRKRRTFLRPRRAMA